MVACANMGFVKQLVDEANKKAQGAGIIRDNIDNEERQLIRAKQTSEDLRIDVAGLIP